MASARTQVYLSDEQRSKLDLLMKREKKSLAHLIREAVDDYLAKAVPDTDEAAISPS